MRISNLLLSLLVFSTAASAGTKDFDTMVKTVEQHYGVKRTHIPLLGVASFFVKTARPEGVRGFKLALFEDLPTAQGNWEFMDHFPIDGLHRLVRVSSATGDRTYVFAGDPGSSTRLLVATFESSQATLVEVNVSTRALVNLLSDPEHIGRSVSGDPAN